MKKRFQFTILKKISLGFGILIIVVLITNILTYNKFEQNLAANKRISEINTPSIEYLNDLLLMVSNSEMLLQTWIFIDKDSSAISKKELKKIHKETYPQLKKRLIYNVERWKKEEQNFYFDITASIDSLFLKQIIIMDDLNNFDNYQNTELMFRIIPEVTGSGDIIRHTDRIVNNIETLLTLQQKDTHQYTTQMENSFKKFRTFIILMAAFLLISMIFIAFVLSRNLIGSINHINKIIKQMGIGILPKIKMRKRNDEIGEMAASLSHLIEGLQDISAFAIQIGDSKFETNFKPLSNKDVLGNSLLLMRKNLLKANKDAEQRKIENYQRNWTSQGLAEFSDLIRNVSNNLEELSQSVVNKLVSYLDASIGGLFIVNDDNKKDIHIELKAFFAYDRHKFITKRIEIGETLVGQCFQEQETIFLTDIPDNYLKITSGLGSDKPKSILITPLKVNEKIFGIVEIASFKTIEKFQIDFIERIGETIASAISAVKINIRTNALLKESHEKSRILEKQENVAQKNISEIEENLKQTTEKLYTEKNINQEYQEEEKRYISKLENLQSLKEKEISKEVIKYNNLILAINNSFPYYELNINGEFLYVNNKYLDLINYNRKEIIGMKHNSFMSRDFINSGNYKNIWDEIKKGKSLSASTQYMLDGKSFIYNEKYSPILDENNQLNKIIVFCQA